MIIIYLSRYLSTYYNKKVPNTSEKKCASHLLMTTLQDLLETCINVIANTHLYHLLSFFNWKFPNDDSEMKVTIVAVLSLLSCCCSSAVAPKVATNWWISFVSTKLSQLGHDQWQPYINCVENIPTACIRNASLYNTLLGLVGVVKYDVVNAGLNISSAGCAHIDKVLESLQDLNKHIMLYLSPTAGIIECSTNAVDSLNSSIIDMLENVTEVLNSSKIKAEVLRLEAEFIAISTELYDDNKNCIASKNISWVSLAFKSLTNFKLCSTG